MKHAMSKRIVSNILLPTAVLVIESFIKKMSQITYQPASFSKIPDKKNKDSTDISYNSDHNETDLYHNTSDNKPDLLTQPAFNEEFIQFENENVIKFI